MQLYIGIYQLRKQFHYSLAFELTLKYIVTESGNCFCKPTKHDDSFISGVAKCNWRHLMLKLFEN